MPTVFSAKLDGSEATMYSQVSLVIYFLKQSRVHAENSLLVRDDVQFKEALLALMFSTLCMEAFANEMAENTLESKMIYEYKKLQRSESVAARVSWIFLQKWSQELRIDESPLQDVQEMFKLRNRLVHYKIAEEAGKIHLPPPVTTPSSGGGFLTAIDFMQEPIHEEPSLVQIIDRNIAVESFNTVLRVIKRWNKEAGAPEDTLENLRELDAKV